MRLGTSILCPLQKRIYLRLAVRSCRNKLGLFQRINVGAATPAALCNSGWLTRNYCERKLAGRAEAWMVATAAHRRWPWPTGCHPRSAATAAQPLSSAQSRCRCQAICKHLPENLKNTRSPAPPFLLAVALDQDSHNLKNPAA